MRKHFNTPKDSLQGKNSELKRVCDYLFNNCATATMVATALNIYRPNLCRRKRALEKVGRLAEVKKGICPITKYPAKFLTTNPALFPINPQQKLF